MARAPSLQGVLWLGGMCGVGKTTAATRAARRHDLWLYPMDSRMIAHAEILQLDSRDRTPDAMWLDRSPEEMADEFELESRLRFHVAVEELSSLRSDGAPILVEGSLLPPRLVGDAALFVVAKPELIDAMLRRRGSLAFERTRDPELAHSNRVRRDALLGERMRAATNVVEINDVAETERVVEGFVHTWAGDWIAQADHGDVAGRRRNANDLWLDQWRRYVQIEPLAANQTAQLACECDRRGCLEQVLVRFGEITRPLLAH